MQRGWITETANSCIYRQKCEEEENLRYDDVWTDIYEQERGEKCYAKEYEHCDYMVYMM